MKFHESGLPNEAIVEKAFNYSRANMMTRGREETKQLKERIAEIFDHNNAVLDAQKKGMPKEEYDNHKKNIERIRDNQLNSIPGMVQNNLDGMFKQRRVALALELANNAESASPEIIAAVLLADCVRSPIDYKNIEKEFGAVIGGIVAEVVHVDAYPSERADNLAKASPDVRRAHLAMVINAIAGSTKQIEQIMKANPMNRAALPPGQEEEIFDDVKPVWGIDKKLDARLTGVFNKLAERVSSAYRLETGPKGELELVKGAVPKDPKQIGPAKPPKGPNAPGGNEGIGGGVF